MTSSSSTPPALRRERIAHEADARDWFLRDSSWEDTLWRFAPTSVYEEALYLQIRWDFSLPSGRRFTEPPYAELLESAKQIIALIRARSLKTRQPQRGQTAELQFSSLRELIRWMDAEGIKRFGQIDPPAFMQFLGAIRGRRGLKHRRLATRTVRRYLGLFVYMYAFRRELSDALTFNPFSSETSGQLAGVRRGDRGRRPYTPDAVATPLIQGAIDFLSSCAFDILRVREIYALSIEAALARGCTRNWSSRHTRYRLRELPPPTSGTPHPIRSMTDLAEQVELLYAACFVVLAYLVGLRRSEILHLQAGCVKCLQEDESHSPITVIEGRIFKQEVGYHGRLHRWVAPPPAVHAIAVLEALSAAHRARVRRSDLWLRARAPKSQHLHCVEWERGFRGALVIARRGLIGNAIDRFAARLNLPLHEGKPWPLSSNQGRKTFARFVGLRDRSSLFALAQHLGHRERSITDGSYVGNDHELSQEIDAEILEQSVGAWEHMLAAPTLGGRGGAEILAKRPRFRGRRLKADIRTYARTLVDAGLVLGVCDWGFCVYREESSACRGTAYGPSPVRREPSTCARCKNFALSAQHRAYWVEQARRNEALLNEPALPAQTLKIARERLHEALALIRSIDFGSKDAAS